MTLESSEVAGGGAVRLRYKLEQQRTSFTARNSAERIFAATGSLTEEVIAQAKAGQFSANIQYKRWK
jgi:hypothetical protein